MKNNEIYIFILFSKNMILTDLISKNLEVISIILATNLKSDLIFVVRICTIELFVENKQICFLNCMKFHA